MHVHDSGWLAGHKLIDPDGNEVLPGEDIRYESEVVTFHAITRSPGDGTGTNGKIDATMVVEATATAPQQSWRSEFYPPNGYRIVPREGFDADAYYASH